MTPAESVLASGLFDTVGGLPMHPLVVHFAVVLLPLSALGLIAIIIKSSWRKTFGPVVLVGLLIGAIAAYVAKESGESLAKSVGLPVQHADYGKWTLIVAGLLFLVALAWFLVSRKETRQSGLSLILATASVVLAIIATVLTIVVGHTGAEAAWAGRIPAASGSSSASAKPSAKPTASASAAASSGTSAAGTYTMADVAKHNSASDCWAAINGNAYNLTNWINQHPGGPGVIEALCGNDGTAAFNGQHGGQGRPASELQGFLLGPVKG